MRGNSKERAVQVEKPEKQDEEKKIKKTHDEVVLGVVGLAPGRHDEGIVGGNHNNLLDTLGLEGLNVLDEAGQVVGLACGCESARDGDKDNLLVLED